MCKNVLRHSKTDSNNNLHSPRPNALSGIPCIVRCVRTCYVTPKLTATTTSIRLAPTPSVECDLAKILQPVYCEMCQNVLRHSKTDSNNNFHSPRPNALSGIYYSPCIVRCVRTCYITPKLTATTSSIRLAPTP
ncbi:hypothetical protein J6590_035231 [Homalodisca vitripennis]|nr:hypothetical protein J6590_035231 [Homalodisca vitripennis]